MIRYFFAVIILFSFYCCNTRTEYNHDCTINDSTITSDPFRSFTPDIYTSINQNNKYQEVFFYGVLKGVNIDKRYYEDIKDSMIFVSSGFHGANFLLHIPRRICLPENGNKLEIEIVYEYAPYPNITNLFLETVFYNKNTVEKEYIERISPTMKIGDKSKKKNITTAKYKYQIPDRANNVLAILYTYDKNAVERLYVKDSIYTTETGVAYLALKKFGFKVNGKPLEEYAYDHKIPFTKQEVDNIRSNVDDSLKINDNARIVGLGESIHGNSAFYKETNELIKQLIAEGFTLIGLETPITDGIRLNDYITGRNNDNIDSILSKNNTLNFYNNSVTKELFDYLKTYNKSHNNRISVFGFDVPLMDYKDSLKVYSAIDFKINNANIYNANIYNKYLKNFYNKFGSYYNKGLSYELLQRHRDRIMSENIFYMDSIFSEKNKMVLVAHLGHLSKREFPEHSTGFFLSERYRERYNVIGLFTGKGSFLSQHFEGFNKERIIRQYPLSSPIGKSLEQLCNTFDKNLFYINDVKKIELLDKILYSFDIGSGYKVMQFEPIDIRKELDNICFIKDSDAY